MIDTLKKLLDQLDNAQNPYQELSKEQRQRATAALLIEVATIDQHLDDSELDTLQSLLAQRFSLPAEEIHQLVDDAKRASREATSLYEFTQQINQLCSHEEKYQLMFELWSVAYADSVLDKHEEHIMRRIADLIHVSHSDFIKAKHQAKSEST